MQRWIVEIDSLQASVVTAIYFADESLTTLPGDTPANTPIPRGVKNLGGYEQHIDPQDPANSAQTAGAVTLYNTNRELNYFRNFPIGGRGLRISRTTEGWAEREAVFTGISTQPLIGYSDVQIGIADRLDVLRVPLQDTLYAGTTIDGTQQDAEGRPSDFGGKPKPLLFGKAFNIPAPAVDVFNNVYQVADSTLDSIDAVRDSGVALTFGTDRADLAVLYATAPASGAYDTCLAESYFRLGSSPTGEITCDATEGTDLTPGDVAKRIFTHIGVSDVDTASLTAYAASVTDDCGVWIGTESTEALGVLQFILGSGGAGLTVNPLGLIRCIQITAPSGVADVTALPSQIIESGAIVEIASLPVVWRVVVRYAKYHQTQNDLAGAATAEYGQQWREVFAEDALVRADYPLAVELVVETAFADEAGAQAFADDWHAIHKIRREIYTVSQKASLAEVTKIGDLAQIDSPAVDRDGVPLRVIGIDTAFLTDRVEWQCWG